MDCVGTVYQHFDAVGWVKEGHPAYEKFSLTILKIHFWITSLSWSNCVKYVSRAKFKELYYEELTNSVKKLTNLIIGTQ